MTSVCSCLVLLFGAMNSVLLVATCFLRSTARVAPFVASCYVRSKNAPLGRFFSPVPSGRLLRSAAEPYHLLLGR